jgi:hypothetical protein
LQKKGEKILLGFFLLFSVEVDICKGSEELRIKSEELKVDSEGDFSFVTLWKIYKLILKLFNR